MSIVIPTASGNRNALTRQELAPTALKCNVAGLLEPTIIKGTCLTGNGSSANPLNVLVSPAVGNTLTCTAAGLFVAATAGVQTPLTVVDTSSIDFTASGTDNHTLTGVVKISATVGNQTSINADGLFTPKGAGLTATSSTCATVTVTAGDITVVPIISPAVGNQLTCTATGLFVAAGGGAITVLDTSCVNLTLVGTVLSADPIIAVQAATNVGVLHTTANSLSCTAAGLLNTVAITSTNTCAAGGIGTTGTGTDGQGATVGYMIRTVTAAGNTFTVDSAPEHTTRGASTSEAVVPNANISPVGTINSNLFPLAAAGYTFTNPSSCRSMTVLTLTNFQEQFVFTTGGQWTIRGQVSVNGGAPVTVTQLGFGTVPGIIGLPNFHASQDVRTLAAGANFSWQVRHQVQTTVGAAAGATWVSYASNISSLGSTV